MTFPSLPESSPRSAAGQGEKSKFFYEHQAMRTMEGHKGYDHNTHGWRFALLPPPKEHERVAREYHLPCKEPPQWPTMSLKYEMKLKGEKHHINNVKIALRSYNKKANDRSDFQFSRLSNMGMIVELGAAYYHYNFLAKSGSNTKMIKIKMFFAEVDTDIQDEDGVHVCCTVAMGEGKRFGRCYSCEDQSSYVLHPSTEDYIGGHEGLPEPTLYTDDEDEKYGSSEGEFD